MKRPVIEQARRCIAVPLVASLPDSQGRETHFEKEHPIRPYSEASRRQHLVKFAPSHLSR